MNTAEISVYGGILNMSRGTANTCRGDVKNYGTSCTWRWFETATLEDVLTYVLCVCGGVSHATAPVGRSEDDVQELIFFYHVDPED